MNIQDESNQGQPVVSSYVEPSNVAGNDSSSPDPHVPDEENLHDNELFSPVLSDGLADYDDLSDGDNGGRYSPPVPVHEEDVNAGFPKEEQKIAFRGEHLRDNGFLDFKQLTQTQDDPIFQKQDSDLKRKDYKRVSLVCHSFYLFSGTITKHLFFIFIFCVCLYLLVVCRPYNLPLQNMYMY